MKIETVIGIVLFLLGTGLMFLDYKLDRKLAEMSDEIVAEKAYGARVKAGCDSVVRDLGKEVDFYRRQWATGEMDKAEKAMKEQK